jgi:tetratricopeptide (TPR) repeat protein
LQIFYESGILDFRKPVMAKVSLRIYNREIEGMIDQGRTDEAIAHCHHILKTFPKHLETYRLLGKSYLESKRYNEAVDIFGRVLMSVPDDFVAHVGMSIIRDEENKLDDSIWHMERAFEAKSANAAIQGELQRLYGRRDGMEPPKIRMTRGALAHMYVQGELYPQAIAEIRAVLAQDPQRSDMQVLLALSYFKSGQKSDASNICTQLLKRYPYSFDANRIMVELLSATAASAEDAQLYRVRSGELDPYATLVKDSIFQSNEIADGAINLDRLEYSGRDVPMGQEWGSSLGIGLGTSPVAALSAGPSDDAQPDWLRSGGFSDAPLQSSPAFESSTQSKDEIPDFLRTAGWAESTSPEQPTSIFDEHPGDASLAPAVMPDWLKGQMPSASGQSSQPAPADAQSLETPDWLRGLADAPSVGSLDSVQPKSDPPSVTPDWLNALGGTQQTSESVQTNAAPDWLSRLSENSAPTQPEPVTDAPDWLSSLGGSAVSNVPAQTTNAPDWLNAFGDAKPSETKQPENVPDWLKGLEDNSKASVPAQPANIPDWLGTFDDKQFSQPATLSVQNLGASAQEQDDAVSWLESLAAKHGAKPEELVTDPNKRSEVPPDWVSQAQALNQKEVPLQTPPASVDNLGSTAQEQDDAVAWLESLAAKHGAKPEELVTDPSKRIDTPPEWVSQAQNQNLQVPATQMPVQSVESLGSTAQEQDDAVAWLESLAAKHGAKPEELVTDPNKRFEKPPDWVSQAQSIGEAQAASAVQETQSQKPEVVDNALNIGEQFFAEFENASTSTPAPSANDETGMWLRDLEKKEKEEEFSSKQSNDLPDWLTDAQSHVENVDNQIDRGNDMPAWLSDAQVPVNSTEQPPTAQKSDLPNWLSGIESESAVENTFSDNSLSNNDLSNWLSGLDDEPGLPFDALPTPDSILTTKSDPVIVPNAFDHTDPGISKSSAIPDWLSTDDAQKPGIPAEDLWKKSFGDDPVPAASVRTEEPAPVTSTGDLPEWLQGANEKHMDPDESEDGDDTPPWLHREKWEAADSQPPKPTAKSDWHPIDASMDQRPTIAAAVPAGRPLAQTLSEVDQTMPSPNSIPVASKKKPTLPAKQPRQVEMQAGGTALNQAKGELDRGDIPTALDHYGKLIKKGKNLDETIRDLNESLYRYPVEVGIWQTLGDAYMRANRLKEALEAYNKAEELIR